MKANTIEDCHKLAHTKNGKCLSKIYINAFTKYLWQCEKGHIWSANYNNAQSKNRWCSECARNKKLSIEQCNILAKKNNGICLSTDYRNNSSPLEWKCNKGHIWKAHYNNIKNGRWCPDCKSSRTKETYKRKYGVEHNYHLPNVALQGARSQKRSYIALHWKTSEQLVCVASYEKKVVEWLNQNKIDFEWQSKVFQTPFKTKTGITKTYRPDFYLVCENKWVEIKGYFREESKKKWDWFHQQYPTSELWDRKKLKSLGIL